MILLAAVIAAGFAALAWTMSNANSYVTQYGASAGSSINQLKESVAFEYVFYDSTAKTLTAYILNCGKIDNVSLTAAYVMYNGTHIYDQTSGVLLYFLNKTSTPVLSIGQEGYFVLSSPLLASLKGDYMIQIQTGRGSFFENTFSA